MRGDCWRCWLALAVVAAVEVAAERVSDLDDGSEASALGPSPNLNQVVRQQQRLIGSLRAEVESLRHEAQGSNRSSSSGRRWRRHYSAVKERYLMRSAEAGPHLEMHDAIMSKYSDSGSKCHQVILESQEEVEAFAALQCETVQRLTVWGNVTDLLPLRELRRVQGYFRIQRTQLSALHGLGNLVYVGHLVLLSNTRLQSLRGLGNFTVNELLIAFNERLESFDGLQQLTEIGGRLEIYNNSRLQSLSDLSNLWKIAGFMNVGYNNELVSLHGLESLKEVWGNINILNNQALQTLQGLNHLNIVGRIVVAMNPHLEVLGGLFAYSESNAVINSLSIDYASWPRCVTPQERRFLSTPELYREPNDSSVPEASWAPWVNNSCGPGPHECWVGMPCLVNLSNSSFVGGLGMTNRTCAPCDTFRGLATAGADHVVNITEYLVGHFPGDYNLCRCWRGKVGAGPVAQLSFYGHAMQQNFSCVRGAACRLHLPGHGLRPSDSVVLMHQCGGTDGPGNRAFRDDAGVYRFSDPHSLAAVMPGLYRLCWRPPCGEDPSCRDVEIGTLRVQGPFVREATATEVGATLEVPNDGDGVTDTDRLMILHVCGEVGAAVPVAQSWRMMFTMSLDPDTVRTDFYRKCWCQVSPSMPCNKSEHFMADMGGLEVVCPPGQEPLSPDKSTDKSTGKCVDCPAGRQKHFKGMDSCSMHPEYVLAQAIAAWSLFWAFHLCLNNIRQPVVIDDVFRLGDKTIIKTVGQHCLHMYGRASFQVSLVGTTHPLLDSPKETFRACKHSKSALELLSHKGTSIAERLDTSRGAVVVPLMVELWHHGWPVPLGISVLLLLVTSALITHIKDVRPFHFLLGVVVALTAALFMCWIKSMTTRVSELERRLNEFREELQQQNPQPAACEKGPSRAIQLVKLFEVVDFFQPFIRDRNAYYMDGNIFGPLTAPEQLSYAELVGPRNVEWFVSHFWGHPFIHFYDSLRKHAELVSGPHTWHQVAYWICFCSNNQYQIKHELGSSWEESSFFLALNSGLCRGVCMVLDDLAVPLTRSWCIFELLQTLKLERQKSDFSGLMLCTAGGVLNSGQGSVEVAMNLARKVATLDLKNASASCDSDKAMINDQVVKELGSFRAMNIFIREKMHGILQEARGETGHIFDNLFRTMKSSIDGPDDSDSDEGSPVPGSLEPAHLD